MTGVAQAVRGALELDRLRAHGRAAGLTEAEVDEVIETWRAWYRTTPLVLEPAVIRSALTNRSLGKPWMP